MRLRILIYFGVLLLGAMFSALPCMAKANASAKPEHKSWRVHIRQSNYLFHTDQKKPEQENYIKKRFDNRSANYKNKNATLALCAKIDKITFNPLCSNGSFFISKYAFEFTPLYLLLIYPKHWFW